MNEVKTLPRVVNKYKEDYDVYIGRGSYWGNPYTHIKDKETKASFTVKTREESISKYREYLFNLYHPHVPSNAGQRDVGETEKGVNYLSNAMILLIR